MNILLTHSGTGLQMYAVNDFPTQRMGLTETCIDKPYFGTYPIELDSYVVQLAGSGMMARDDNSYPTWRSLDVTVSQGLASANANTRLEVLQMPEGVKPDLGNDVILCEGESHILSSDVVDGEVSWLWNTGETSSSIIVTNPGVYWMDLKTECSTLRDTVVLAVMQLPAPVSFPQHEICSAIPVILAPEFRDVYGRFEWQDGSTDTTLLASTSGKYWVKVSNDCGVVSDTVRVTIDEVLQPPNVITPNGDDLNETFRIELTGTVDLKIINRWGSEVYRNTNYQNDWDGSGLSTGVYYYQFLHSCLNKQVVGTVSIVR
jgi:hypothetical protein